MRVQPKAGNHMPVHVWHHVAETGEIDFLGLEKLALRLFDSKHDAHQFNAFGVVQVSHLARMPLQDDPTKSRMILIVYVDDACQCV